MNPDHDDDDIPDGLEVATGSSPTDPASGDISSAVTSIVVNPSDILIDLDAANDISLEVKATAEAGGRQYQLTVSEDRFGTQYVSNDSSIIESLGDGQFALRKDGETSIDVTLGAASANIPVKINPGVGPQGAWRLRPMLPAQRLYAGSNHAKLWLEYEDTQAVGELLSVTLDGQAMSAKVNNLLPTWVYRAPKLIEDEQQADIVYDPASGGFLPLFVRFTYTGNSWDFEMYANICTDSSCADTLPAERLFFVDDGNLSADDHIKNVQNPAPGNYIMVVTVGNPAPAIEDVLANKPYQAQNTPPLTGNLIAQINLNTSRLDVQPDSGGVSIYSLELSSPNGVPAQSNGELEIRYTGALDGEVKTEILTVPVNSDPDAVIVVDPSVPDTLQLKVGEPIQVPINIEDPGLNDIRVEYLLDGELLEAPRKSTAANPCEPYPECNF